MTARISRFLSHNPTIRRKRGQSHSSEGIHNEIDPEHLRDIQRGVYAGKSAYKNNQTRAYVYYHLEEDKPSNVHIQRATPENGLVNAREGIVKDCDVADLFSSRRAVSHR